MERWIILTYPFKTLVVYLILCSKIEDKELNQALQDLSDSIDKSYKNSGVYEFITNKYRKK